MVLIKAVIGANPIWNPMGQKLATRSTPKSKNEPPRSASKFDPITPGPSPTWATWFSLEFKRFVQGWQCWLMTTCLRNEKKKIAISYEILTFQYYTVYEPFWARKSNALVPCMNLLHSLWKTKVETRKGENSFTPNLFAIVIRRFNLSISRMITCRPLRYLAHK